MNQPSKKVLVTAVVLLAASAAFAKDYTPAQLKKMVASGHPPPQLEPQTTSKEMEYNSCKAFVQQMVSAASGDGVYPKTVGETKTAYVSKIWTNDGAIVLTCSQPGVFLTTVSKYK